MAATAMVLGWAVGLLIKAFAVAATVTSVAMPVVMTVEAIKNEKRYQDQLAENARLEAKADAQYAESVQMNFMQPGAYAEMMRAYNRGEQVDLTVHTAANNVTNSDTFARQRQLYMLHSFGPTPRNVNMKTK